MLVDVGLILVVLVLMHLNNVIAWLVMRILWMATILLYNNIKGDVDGTEKQFSVLCTIDDAFMHVYI